ncbi:MAG TPA: MBL fold metallo-hydrolase [Gemmatimonadales bacterium]|nr:MBL fold metallo-hydrolase [Gemmatimonadales bacterium]
MVGYRDRRVMIDCGEDWLGRFQRRRPDAIVVTHAHPDHAWGLRDGAPCPVFATRDTWDRLGYDIADRRIIGPYTPVRIAGITFEAFPVEHSTRAPAVGYRVTAAGVAIFYVPDLVYIYERRAALAGVQLYVGDGATVTRPLVRRRGRVLIGHASIGTQLGWCEKEGVPTAIFTHCGTEILKADERRLAARIRDMARERGVEAAIARDGLRLALRSTGV